MASDKILIKPEALDNEISNAKNAVSEVRNLTYKVETTRTILTSIDRYKESISLLDESLKSFAALLDSDVKNLELIKAEWLKLDQISINKIFNN